MMPPKMPPNFDDIHDPKVLAAFAAASASVAQDAATATKEAIGALADEVRKLRESLDAHPTHAQVRRARYISIASVLFVAIIGLVLVRVESNRANVVLRAAFYNTCEERRDLEAVLRGIVASASRDDPDDTESEQRRARVFAEQAIEALTSPPCSRVIPELRSIEASERSGT